jgi:non-homologous end joining protein Ku
MIVLLGLLMPRNLVSSIRPKSRSFKRRRFRQERPAVGRFDLMEALRQSLGREQASRPAKKPKKAASGQN